MAKEDLIAIMGPDKYEVICKWAKQTAPLRGKTPNDPIPEEIQQLIYNLADSIWDQLGNVEDKLKVTFEIYLEAPNYSFIFQIAVHQYADMSKQEKDIFWHQCIGFLSSEDSGLSAPVEYSLWCDFFEDPAEVNDVWNRLFNGNRNRLFIGRILDSSGPVPYSLKEKLYLELISDPQWHVHIYRSLLHSSFDYFGQTDKKKARNILKQLEVSDQEHLRLLVEKLQE